MRMPKSAIILGELERVSTLRALITADLTFAYSGHNK